MPRVSVPFVGTAYKMPALQLDSQNCINWYLVGDPQGKEPTALFPRPGLVQWSSGTADEEVRGLFTLNGVLYAVIGESFRIYDDNGAYSEKGTINSRTGNVRMVANDSQVFITDTKDGYVYQIIDSNNRTAGDFFKIENASSAIGPATFVGSGPLDDMETSGVYTGTTNKTYRVEIDSTGTGVNPDTFRWSDTDGNIWNATTVQITGGDQDLNDGVVITFQHINGHIQNDYWTFDTTTDSAFYVPIIPAYQDGYGVYAKQVSTRWYLSKEDDFAEVNALDFASAGAFPDDVVAIISVQEELWILCRITSEIWYNTGAQDFPFQRRANLVMNYGCAAPYSLAIGHNNILFWLARNRDGGFIIVNVIGYNIIIISTEALHAEIRSYSKVDDAIGWVTQWDGHIFYIITFPSADRTWAYDLITKTWSEWRSRRLNTQPSDNEYINGRWIANNYVFFNGKYLVGDYNSGEIHQLSSDVYTDDGEMVICERTTRVLANKLNRISIYSLEIDFERGRGLTTGQGSEPQIMLQVSKDGGITYGNELWRTASKIGQYKVRAKWNRLGTARAFVFRIRMTDPTYRVILGAVIDIEDLGS
jgi:hypothetical protein